MAKKSLIEYAKDVKDLTDKYPFVKDLRDNLKDLSDDELETLCNIVTAETWSKRRA